MHGLVKGKKPVLSSEGRVHPIITLRYSCASWLPRPSYPSVQLYLVITASRPTKKFVLTSCLYWTGQFKNKYVARGQSNVNWLKGPIWEKLMPSSEEYILWCTPNSEKATIYMTVKYEIKWLPTEISRLLWMNFYLPRLLFFRQQQVRVSRLQKRVSSKCLMLSLTSLSFCDAPC